jgi:predicted nucleic acid-binding protein
VAATYLVDANVLSEAMRQRPNPAVVAWLEEHERQLVVDAVILGELYAGVLQLPRGRKRRELERWFARVAERIECLAWDSVVGLRWARLIVDLRARGKTIPLLDSLIAASALEHGLTVATRNVADFERARVRVINPFE